MTNIGSLVVMAEIMALCAAFLTGCAASGKLWFALGRLGTLLMAWTCWLVWSTYGTLELAQINLPGGGYDAEPLLWLPGLVGFALLAGRSRCTAGRRRLTPGPARRPPRCFPPW
ncbi:formate hydrogenlyase subunit 3 [Klebsiella variicola]|uniref:Formate hydrogenlyase subunit 3 n=1 Tax=Klebsiella variicola TaxID=244366 RepID=A0A7H4MR18_KLEVA|nr:formate hydrogenlyase subunit 3 [Klebsiella variicola]